MQEKLTGYLSGMRGTRARLLTVAAAALTALCAGNLAPAQPASAASFVPVTGAGSTWSGNAFADWTAAVGQLGMQVDYLDSGSTLGRQDFADGTVDFAAAEIPYGVEDHPPTRGYAYMPDTAGGLAFMYNLHIGGHQVTNLRLSGPVIAGIFTSQITMWNDPKIAADNPGLALPAEPIVPVVRTDSSGSTWVFTQWLSATQSSSWTAYCAAVALSPCAPTTGYPVQPGTAMVDQAGDLGVAAYVAQSTAEGAIGYTEYSYALNTGFPVAKVLNAAGYYTLPSADNVGVSLLNAEVDTDQSSPLYLTEDLSQVYTDTDPRTYVLSYYSYMIVPTDTSFGLTSDKGYTLGAFGQYLLCQGQMPLDQLGYAPLPINLVEDGFAQLQKMPGNAVPTATAGVLKACNNPTMSNGADVLASNAPMPPACDMQGPTQCGPATTGISTTTTLTASPDPATADVPVTLTAAESATDGTSPTGTVQFLIGGTNIGAPVAVDASGVATTTTAFTASGTDLLSAVFAPTSASYSESTGTLSLAVNIPTAGSEPILVTALQTGTLSVTVAPGAVAMAVQGTSFPLVATGTLQDVTVTDSRNYVPGWSVSGQESVLTGSGTAAGATIPGDGLGWVPVSVSPLVDGASLGPVVAVNTNPGGLGDTGSVLAYADAGSGMGTNTVSASLLLSIAGSEPAGPYTGSLTITYLETGPVAGT
jgi:phosphate ABC transporter phosphate-binding protein